MAVYTAGQVLTAAELNDFACDSLTVDTNVLYVDKTNNRVGSGTTSPLEKLHVNESNAADSTQILLENTDQRVRIGAYYEAAVHQYGWIQAEQDAGTDTDLCLNPEGGDVGVGTTNPAELLHIVHNTSGDQAQLLIENTDQRLRIGSYFETAVTQYGFIQSEQDDGTNIDLQIQPEGAQILTNYGTAAAPTYSFVSDTDTGMYGASGVIAFSVAGTKRLQIDNSGVATFSNEIEVADGGEADPSYTFENDATSGFYLASSTTGTMRHTVKGVDKVQVASGNFSPVDNNSISCGLAAAEWSVVYANNTNIQSSDLRMKEITADSLGLDFVCDLKPFTGRWRNPSDWDGGMAHQWLGAQDVRDALVAHGVDPDTSALWHRVTEDVDGNPVADGRQQLAYGELIPVLVKAVQELAARG